MLSTGADTICLLAALCLVSSLLWRSRRIDRTLPPGPRPLPLVGNLFDITVKEFWLRVSSWADIYGDVVYLRIFGQGLLFLNSFETARRLLEERSVKYADRPHTVMCAELCGCERIIAFATYGDSYRRHRRLLHHALSSSHIPAYKPVIQRETYALLKLLIQSPENHAKHIRFRYAGSQITSIVYGFRVEGGDDPHLARAEEALHLIANRIFSVNSGLWLVDLVPFLKHLPSWFPGAGFKRRARAWKAKIEECADEPFQRVKDKMEEGDVVPCYCSMMLSENTEALREDPQLESDIRWTAHAMYIASIDTTYTLLSHFVLAMVRHPHVLRKAQTEIDSLTGGARLPAFADRPALPYVDAIMSECMRWTCPVPLGLPHRVMEDDVYEGMFIPKGTLVFANIWRITRDPEQFPDPEEFVPERYLEETDAARAKRGDPRNCIFGFGRRACPGEHLVEAYLWHTIACMLAVFNFSKASDEAGELVEPRPEYHDAAFRQPTNFPCDIRPRSERAAKLVHEALAGFA
ncbi:cytochrome P450 [Trametes cingulata]|nr:cytochrome P450 [Trametes cingulata]